MLSKINTEILPRQRFGYWLTVDKVVGGWICRCECGTEKIVRSQSLYLGMSKSCGCKARKSQSETWTDKYGSKENRLLSRLYGRIKSKAKIRKLDWDLSKEAFKKLVFGPCTYCGKNPSNHFKNEPRHTFKINLFYNGIDRKDNTIGYLEQNCVSCCKICNIMKNNLSMSDFAEQIRLIYQNLDLIDKPVYSTIEV